jgi:uncharacterized protein
MNIHFSLCFSRQALLAAAVMMSASCAVFAQKEYSIAAVQGNKNVSPIDGQTVKVKGVVTARVRNGFFLQTPDDLVDQDNSTSEGLFIFTSTEPGAEAAIGNLVSVSGTVAEFRPRAEPNTLPITQLTLQRGRDLIQVISKGNELPKPIVVGTEQFAMKVLDELERFEGMRVAVTDLTVIQPTGGRVDIRNDRSESNGIFYGIVKGMPRPFREPGYNLYDYVFLSDKEKADMKKAYPKLPIFGSHPYRLRIESAAQLGSQPIDVPAHTQLRNIVGVMYYAYRSYAILTDPTARPAIANTITQISMPPPTDGQLTVAASNLENLFDDEDDPAIKEEISTSEAFGRRLRKISGAVRTIMQSPDVIGIVEAENLSTLRRLAQRINADTEASGKPNPKYEAYLEEGNDGRGIDVGFLVKSSRVKVVEVKQLGKDIQYDVPGTSDERFLNDRPPLLLRATVNDPKTNEPFGFTVVVNHLKSFLGYMDPKQQASVRSKKKLQAEFLAKTVQERQKANPGERIILIGDFNAYQFNDGIVDVIGTIKGNPAPKGEVMNPSDDLVDPDLIDLVDLIAADQRYSYYFEGFAQVLDHAIITENLRPYLHGFGYARMNADFPESYRNDENRPHRFSDHDAPVAYFNLTPRAAAPRPTPTP